MIENGNWYSFEIGKIGLDGNIEFDYDKLACAIIELSREKKEEILEREPQELPKLTIGLFFKTLSSIITGKIETNGEITMGVFAILLATFFRMLSIVGFLGLALVGYKYIDAFINGKLLIDILGMSLVYLPISFGCVIFSAFLWAASNEIMKEKDKNFVVSVFSGVVAFVALVVAFLQFIGEIE